MKDLKFRCPFCDSAFEVQLEQLGHQIACPTCQRPIRIEAPLARPIFDSGSDSSIREESRRGQEKSIIKTHPAMLRAHPIRFLILLLMMVGGTGFGIWSMQAQTPSNQLIPAGSATLAVLGLLGLIIWWFLNMSTTLEITSHRTRLSRGLLAKETSEVQHEDVRNIQVRQSVYQRLVNVGLLAVSSSGQDDLEIKVDGVSNPEKIADEIRKRQ